MSGNLDLSGAMEQLQAMLATEEGQNNLKAMVEGFAGGSEESSAETQQNSGGFDLSNPETLLKIQSLMSAFQSQSNSSDAQFLRALRPYLKESRRAKLDQAEKLMGVAKVVKIMQETGGLP